jgi:hypothetical protein
MEQKAKRRKFGLLDVLIILVVIGVIVFAVKYSDNKSTSAGSGQGNNITFTVEIGKVEKNFFDGVEVEDAVYDNAKGGYLGEVVSTELKPYTTRVVDEKDGKIRYAEVEGMYNAYVTIAAQAVIGESSTTVNNVSVMIGQELYPRSSDFAGSGYCVELDLEGGAQE